ncbi:hypothetical protein GJU40_16225 [Bacillus lacus]|uniref:Uncharacterized protein n=1 Tax=Metabacillus lacus TaxID=1983721 RepID=A0A7X2M044_9BACI|nr:hypothetical protein [Metabacillus lacus]MRX73688.1 hypothetical protein [Metabacillus lacus]
MGLNEGEIIINNKEINVKLNSKGFLSCFSSEVTSHVNGHIERYHFINSQIINGLSLWVKITFNKGCLISIELKNAELQ